MSRTPQEIGRRNKNKGESFQQLVANRASVLELSLIVKNIDRVRRRGGSLPDTEFVDFPELMVDCKHTDGRFSFNEKRQMLLECHTKYCCADSDIAIIVCGEKQHRQRLQVESVVACYQVDDLFLMTPLDDFLRHLDRKKQKLLVHKTQE